MDTFGAAAKRFLYHHLSLKNYLRVVSRLYFVAYRTGWKSSIFEYPRFLKYLAHQGDTIIDIGANLGYYAYIFARHVGPEGKVWAVEPVGPILDVLRRNVKGLPQVEILPYALGAEEKSIRMGNDSSRDTGYFGTGQNFVMEQNASAEAAVEFRAEMRRGSELFSRLERLDAIKCDIEGYEEVVIPEMAPVIEKFLPAVLIETGGEKRTAIRRFFAERGYEAFTLHGNRMRPLEGREDDGKDILFIHSTKKAPFIDRIEPCA